jgi:hypothetical protein
MHFLNVQRNAVLAVTIGCCLLMVLIGCEKINYQVHTAITQDLNVAVNTGSETIEAGTPTILKFHLTDTNGEPFTDLLVHHARILHVVLVSENLQIVGHIHPEDFDPRNVIEEQRGIYTVQWSFPEAGRYIIALDVVSPEAEFARHLYVDVIGEPQMGAQPRDFRREKTVNGYTDEGNDRYTKPIWIADAEDGNAYHVKMEAPEQIKAGERVHITYHFSRHQEPITDLVPFLDAPMHFAIVNSQLDSIVHTHGTLPNSEPLPVEGHGGHNAAVMADAQGVHNAAAMDENPAGAHNATEPQQMHHGASINPFGPTVNLTTTFHKAGIYQIFCTTKHTDQIIWVSFMVEVEN